MPGEQVPSVGRVVHYVLEVGPHQGDHRPAIIVNVWSRDLVNLQVFTDGGNDVSPSHDHRGPESMTLWRTSRPHDEETKALGTWHWPEFVPPVEAKL